jgi:hypothetical protein
VNKTLLEVYQTTVKISIAIPAQNAHISDIQRGALMAKEKSQIDAPAMISIANRSGRENCILSEIRLPVSIPKVRAAKLNDQNFGPLSKAANLSGPRICNIDSKARLMRANEMTIVTTHE